MLKAAHRFLAPAIAVIALLGLGAADAEAGHRKGKRKLHTPPGVHAPRAHRPVPRGAVVVVPQHRRRHYRNVVVLRPHGHWYRGYGHHHEDHNAFKWLAFTAITLKALDVLSESQQRAHESAQIRATTAPVGETIQWNEAGASGTVTALREGTSTSGRYCREFQQTVVVGGRAEDAYGTACYQEDGSWEIVSTGN